MKNSHLLGAVCVILSSISGAANANLIVNGSFETGDLTDWSSSGNILVTNAQGSTDGIFAGLFNGADTTGDGILSQSFSTVIGDTYRLEFDYGVFKAALAPPQTQNMEVELIGGVVLLDTILTETGSSPISFTTFLFDFTADSTTTTLRFTDMTTSAQSVSHDFMLDRVSVAAVPIPAAVWLFGSGLLGLIGIARKKKLAK